VGRCMAAFRDYFMPPNLGGHKWRVRWEAVAKDHPELFDGEKRAPGQRLKANPFDDMITALNDEIVAVRAEASQHPIWATGASLHADLGDGSFLYEAPIELDRDSELPFPEGVGIKLQWRHALPVSAKLLSYDPLNSSIIFELERPLSAEQMRSPFQVCPDVEGLLKAVQARIVLLRDHEGSLVSRLLNPGVQPNEMSWKAAVLASGLDEPQLEAVKYCLGHDIAFLWGPPGTGKTHTLGRVMANLALGGQKVIAASISNVAVDQMALHLVKALDTSAEGRQLLNSGRVLRFGHPRLPEVFAEQRLFPNHQRIQQIRKELQQARRQHRETTERESSRRALLQKQINDLLSEMRRLMKEAIQNARVVITTAVQTCIETAFGETAFDCAVVDEASMMPIPYVLSVGMLARERFIVAGDFRQLAPIALARSSAAYEWLHRDAFALVGIGQGETQHSILRMLRLQRRMHCSICNLINTPFYGGELETATEDQKTEARNLPPLPGSPVVLVEVVQQDGSEVVQTESGSRLNKKTAEVTARLAVYYSDHGASSIGVITPYRAQVSNIKRMLRDSAVSDEKRRRIKIGTVHAFQGSEADVVIFDLVETRHHRIGRLYHGDTGNRLANVAISRARAKLVLVGDAQAFFAAPGAESVGALKGILAHHFPRFSKNIVPLKELASDFHLGAMLRQ